MNKPRVWEISAQPAVAQNPSLTVTRDTNGAEAGAGEPLVPTTDEKAEGTKDALKDITNPAIEKQEGSSNGVTPPANDAPPTTNARSAKEAASTTNARSASPKKDASAPRKRHGAAAAAEGPIETLTYRDPFAGVYKKCVFTQAINLEAILIRLA